jgi:hypothetical protein
VELITPHRTINDHETRKGGQGPVWAVAPLTSSSSSSSHYYASTKTRWELLHLIEIITFLAQSHTILKFGGCYFVVIMNISFINFYSF